MDNRRSVTVFGVAGANQNGMCFVLSVVCLLQLSCVWHAHMWRGCHASLGVLVLGLNCLVTHLRGGGGGCYQVCVMNDLGVCTRVGLTQCSTCCPMKRGFFAVRRTRTIAWKPRLAGSLKALTLRWWDGWVNYCVLRHTPSTVARHLAPIRPCMKQIIPQTLTLTKESICFVNSQCLGKCSPQRCSSPKCLVLHFVLHMLKIFIGSNKVIHCHCH